jgi:RNA polymerase sigma-70 factor (ECF subfamily)
MKILPLYDSRLLFNQLSAGDASAFRRIFDLYKNRLYFIAVKMLKVPAEAEEIVQDVFMALWVNQSKFADIDDPEAYIITVTYNRVYTQLKKTASENKLLAELLYVMQNESYSGDDVMVGRETQAIIDTAIDQLPPQRKLIFQLSRQQGLSHDQIADKLNLSPNTVRNQIAKALQQLRSSLGLTALMVATSFWNNFH